MKQYRITVDGRSFDVRILSDPCQEQVQVEVDGQDLVVAIRSVAAEEKAGDAPPSPIGPGGAVTAPAVSEARPVAGKSVTAPLPGVIKSVEAQPGQQVAVGDHLLVIEAMKMDNVIRASRSGIIESVHVAEGHRVAHGQPMLDYRE